MIKVALIAHTPNPEKTVAAAAKLCYSPATIGEIQDGLTDESADKFVNMLASMGHESPLEHASFTFGIEGVSRSLLAQITRHRIASYSVKSQRYVSEGQFDYVLPPEIEKIPQAKEEYLKAMAEDVEHYNKIADILKAKHTKTLMDEEGLDEKTAAKRAEKMAIEDARFVLPNACETKMVVTMNTRSLLNFFRHRCCNRAQWEIRELAELMFKEVYKVAPGLFKGAGPSCAVGGCSEGKMTCGKAAEMKAKYNKIKGIL
jgi:thymidylate synthase (FAD)